MRRKLNHWCEYLPDFLPTLTVTGSVSRMESAKNEIAALQAEIEQEEEFLKKRILAEYSEDEIKFAQKCHADDTAHRARLADS